MWAGAANAISSLTHFQGHGAWGAAIHAGTPPFANLVTGSLLQHLNLEIPLHFIYNQMHTAGFEEVLSVRARGEDPCRMLLTWGGFNASVAFSHCGFVC